jgi:pseudomonalisin
VFAEHIFSILTEWISTLFIKKWSKVMTLRFTAKMLPFSALLFATQATSVQAEVWVPTATKATTIANTATTTVTHITTMQAASLIHVAVALKLRNKPDLDALTDKIVSGRVTHAINRKDFIRQYAPTKEQAQAAINYLSNNGFTNIIASDNNMLINANGTAASVKSAFNTKIDIYDVNGRTAYANVNDVSVPQSLGGIVLAVLGLQTVHLPHTTSKKLEGKTFTIAGHNPTDFPMIYDAASLPSATNATIGIITAGGMTQTIADLNKFAANAGYPQPHVSTVAVNGASSDPNGIAEWNMDTQSSLAAAGGTIKRMILYAAHTLNDADVTAAYNQAVSDNQAQAINVSLGECENYAHASGAAAAADQIFERAVSQGQMFSVSSGDSGSYECDMDGSSQSYPAVSPYVMALGGTTLSTGSNNVWSAETVWSCSNFQNCQQYGGAGGGPSLTENAPSWQLSSGVLGTSTKRGVPDISLDADPASGALVLINGALEQWGGTSLSAPLFTGFWARVQSQNKNNLAFPATAIYQKAAANPNMFHDITSGTVGGYSAQPGWDYASGYGSLDVSNFAAVMGTNTPPPPPSNVLQNGVSVNDLALAPDEAIHVYSIVVPAGRQHLTFRTFGGQGDSDIFVDLGSVPSIYSPQWWSDGPTNSEYIDIPNPKAGTYYLVLYASTAFRGVTLVAHY